MKINEKNMTSSSDFWIQGIFLTLLFCCNQFATAETAQLTPRQHIGSLSRVKTLVELAGSLNVARASKTEQVSPTADKKSENAESETSPKPPALPEVKIPLKVSGEMFFDEVGVTDEDTTLRHYWDAKADLEINETKVLRKLREDRQLLLLTSGVTAAERITSPYGPLTRDELDLVDVPSNVFPPELLLPNRQVENGETWSHGEDVVAGLLRIEKVSDGTLKSTVKSISESKVSISLSGDLKGTIDGVRTKIEVKGNYQFDRKEKMVTWIALAIREQRDVGFAAPGFSVVSRIRTARQPIEKSEILTSAAIKKTSLRRVAGDFLLDYVSDDQKYQMAVDRRWHPLTHGNFSSQLRMVEDGDLLATCRLDYLTKAVPGTQVTLDGFRDDVQRALGKNCKSIVSAGQSINGQNVRVLRVVASGEVAETPITWIYFHLSDDEGHRLSVVYTLESSMMSRFEGSDQEMASSVFFLKGSPEEKETLEVSRRATVQGFSN